MRFRGRETRSGLGRIQEAEMVGVGVAGFRQPRGESAVRLASRFDEASRLLVCLIGGGHERLKVFVFLRGRPGRKRQHVRRRREHRLEGGGFLDGGVKTPERFLAARARAAAGDVQGRRGRAGLVPAHREGEELGFLGVPCHARHPRILFMH